jgi:D-amino peptidase
MNLAIGTLTPAAACARIATAAREVVVHALAHGWRADVHRPTPVACALRVQTAALADLFCMLPTLARVDAVTLRFSAASVEHAVRTLNSLSAMSFMLR